MKLVIVGGGAGGPATATRARRLDENAEIVLFEKGEHVSYAHCGLPYYTGGVIKDRSNLLVSNPQELKMRYNIDVRLHSEVKAIMPKTRQVEVADLINNKHYLASYDYLILSPGAEPISLPLVGDNVKNIFTLRSLTNADILLEFIHKKQPRRAVVIGGGFIGLEIAENLKLLGMETTIIEMLDQVLPQLDHEMVSIAQQTIKANGVGLVLSASAEAIVEDKGETKVQLRNGLKIPFDLMILAVGVKPNVKLAQSAGIQIGELGGIKVDDYMQTSITNIYAVGDAVETKHLVTGKPTLTPLAGPASRQARVAVDNIYGRKIPYEGTIGTAIVRIFSTVVAITGASEKLLKKEDVPYSMCYLHPFSHANYYPDASPIAIKLLFSPNDGRVLGAQAVGCDGVDKRIDVLATAITAKMAVDDLTKIQLSYAPQFGSGKDAINIAGYVASNILHGDAPTVYWNEQSNINSEKALLLDVRTKKEFEAGAVPGAKHIPLDELRDRLGELLKDRQINVYCAAGLRSYLAMRILQQNGFEAKNISGGFRTYEQFLHNY